MSASPLLPFCFPSSSSSGSNGQFQITDASANFLASAFAIQEQQSLESDDIDDVVKRAKTDFFQGFGGVGVGDTLPQTKGITMLLNHETCFSDPLNQIIRSPPDQLNQIAAFEDHLNQVRASDAKLNQIGGIQGLKVKIQTAFPQPNQVRSFQGLLDQTIVPQSSPENKSVYNSSTCSFNPTNPTKETWHLQQSMCTTDKDGKLSSACGMVTTANGDFAVADMGSGRIKLYDQLGQIKNSISTDQDIGTKQTEQMCHVREVAIAADGRFFVTDKTKFVKVFDQSGMLVQSFATVPPTSAQSDNLAPAHAQLSGLAMDGNQDILLVGEVKRKYISKHRPDGSHIHSIKTNISPWYLAMTSQGNVVVSSSLDQTVQVLDIMGRLLHSLQGPGEWMPTGVCCSANAIYACNFASGCNGVYRFAASSGQYLGCVTNAVTDPTGLALTKDGDRLLVAQWGRRGVKVFGRDVAASSLGQIGRC